MSGAVFHLEAVFRGRVQGVGFRYQVMRVAREFEVCGYARNCGDGSVLIEAEGREEEVLAFQREVAEQMRAFIRRAEAKTDWREPRLRGFVIRR